MKCHPKNMHQSQKKDPKDIMHPSPEKDFLQIHRSQKRSHKYTSLRKYAVWSALTSGEYIT